MTPAVDRVIAGDSREILPTLAPESVDLVVTDPPYLVGYKDRDGRTIAGDTDPTLIRRVFPQIARVMKQNSFCISFYGWNRLETFLQAWRNADLYPVGHIVWQKRYSSSVGFLKYRHEQAFLLAKGRPKRPSLVIPDVLPWQYTGNRVHPTEKAVSVIAPLIQSFSQRGDVVLDPFAGSGSTLVAAALAGRRYIGVEREAKYCTLAEKRLAGVTRRNSEKLSRAQ